MCVEAYYVIEQILPGMFWEKKKKKEKEKNGINMCFDMSEMFVSSLWKGDFDKLFTVMFAF